MADTMTIEIKPGTKEAHAEARSLYGDSRVTQTYLGGPLVITGLNKQEADEAKDLFTGVLGLSVNSL